MNTTFNNVPDGCSLPALFLFICPHLIAFPPPPSLSEPFQEDTTHQNRQRVIAILDPEAAAALPAEEAPIGNAMLGAVLSGCASLQDLVQDAAGRMVRLCSVQKASSAVASDGSDPEAR